MKTTSLQTSKRMKELGFEIETMFSWVEWGEGRSKLIYNDMEHNWNAYTKLSFCPAYTSDELSEITPHLIHQNGLPIEIVAYKRRTNKGYGWCAVLTDVYTKKEKVFSAGTLCEAMALMLIHLKENKLI